MIIIDDNLLIITAIIIISVIMISRIQLHPAVLIVMHLYKFLRRMKLGNKYCQKYHEPWNANGLARHETSCCKNIETAQTVTR